MRATIWNIARWLAWQLGEFDRPAKRPPARITVYSSADRPHRAA